MKKKAYVGVKGYYYKIDAAKAVLDHSHYTRDGFTKSANVHIELSANNVGYFYHGANSCAEALELMYKKHKQVTGKKIRSDNNVLFEHVLWLSEFQYSRLEKRFGADKVKQAVMHRLRKYAQSVKDEFGFEPLGILGHFDEGHYDEDGKFKRNIHFHINFLNYSFEKRMAPLRYMMNKGKSKSGRTNGANPHFEKLQDLAYQSFKELSFHRGEPKNVTGREHLSKEEFVKNKRQNTIKETRKLIQQHEELKEAIKRNTSINNSLEIQIDQNQQKLSWLENQIDKLNKVKSELVQSIKKKSQYAVKSILRKSSYLISSSHKRSKAI